jgi:hypothetical protein
LVIAEAHGDNTPEHFALLTESRLRFHRIGAGAGADSERELDDAAEVLAHAATYGFDARHSAEFAALHGDLAFARALAALRLASVAPDPDDSDLRTATDADGGTGYLKAALANFERAGLHYGEAPTLDRSGRADTSVWTTRRGQSLLRTAQTLRLLLFVHRSSCYSTGVP